MSGDARIPNARVVVAWAVLIAGSPCAGCIGLEVQRKTTDPERSFTAPTEDGAQYISVEGGLLSTRDGMVRKWNNLAHRTCDGDYAVLSDAGYERRRLGVVERRIHEGYVRCVLPDPEQETEDAATASDSEPRRGRAQSRR